MFAIFKGKQKRKNKILINTKKKIMVKNPQQINSINKELNLIKKRFENATFEYKNEASKILKLIESLKLEIEEKNDKNILSSIEKIEDKIYISLKSLNDFN